MEVKNIFMNKGYDISDGERIPIIMNWLGCEGLHFVQTLNYEEQETCDINACLFNVVNMKFKPQHNEMILLLQYCKLCREEAEMLKNGWAI